MFRRRLLVCLAFALSSASVSALADLSPTEAVMVDLVEIAIERSAGGGQYPGAETGTPGVSNTELPGMPSMGHFTSSVGLHPVGERVLAELRTAPFHGLAVGRFVSRELESALVALERTNSNVPSALREVAGPQWLAAVARSLPDDPSAADPNKVAIAARIGAGDDVRVRAWFDARDAHARERAEARAVIETELAQGLRAWGMAMDPSRSLDEAWLESPDVSVVSAALASLVPADPDYGALVRELARLRAIDNAGGWPTHPTDPVSAVSLEGQAAVHARLAADGWFEGPVPAIDDDRHGGAAPVAPELQAAIARFQAHHQLAPTGVVDRDTLEALAVPAAVRAATVARNLDRMRRSPARADRGGDVVLVNVAAYEVRLVLGGDEALRMRAVVGATTESGRNRTPLFSDVMERIELNPVWYVPPRIARRIYASPSRGYEWVGSQLIQRPGPHNSLGRAKFMFPNPHAVYLHDTNRPDLFERAERAASSGCVRVEDPLGLAAAILAHDAGRPVEAVRAEVDAVIASGRTEVANLQRELPVHIEYFTAWVASSGRVSYATDVYGLDAIAASR